MNCTTETVSFHYSPKVSFACATNQNYSGKQLGGPRGCRSVGGVWKVLGLSPGRTQSILVLCVACGLKASDQMVTCSNSVPGRVISPAFS